LSAKTNHWGRQRRDIDRETLIRRRTTSERIRNDAECKFSAKQITVVSNIIIFVDHQVAANKLKSLIGERKIEHNSALCCLGLHLEDLFCNAMQCNAKKLVAVRSRNNHRCERASWLAGWRRNSTKPSVTINVGKSKKERFFV